MDYSLLPTYSTGTELLHVMNEPATINRFLALTFHALKRVTKFPATARFTDYPGTVLPRRIVPNMLGMPTAELRHPMLFFVLMEADDALPSHGMPLIRLPDWRTYCGRSMGASLSLPIIIMIS